MLSTGGKKSWATVPDNVPEDDSRSAGTRITRAMCPAEGTHLQSQPLQDARQQAAARAGSVRRVRLALMPVTLPSGSELSDPRPNDQHVHSPQSKRGAHRHATQHTRTPRGARSVAAHPVLGLDMRDSDCGMLVRDRGCALQGAPCGCLPAVELRAQVRTACKQAYRFFNGKAYKRMLSYAHKVRCAPPWPS